MIARVSVADGQLTVIGVINNNIGRRVTAHCATDQTQFDVGTHAGHPTVSAATD